jgi:hypothetical protein
VTNQQIPTNTIELQNVGIVLTVRYGSRACSYAFADKTHLKAIQDKYDEFVQKLLHEGDDPTKYLGENI